MAIDGLMYLHESGGLIYKPMSEGLYEDLRESDFVKAFWPIDPTDREGAWNCLVEALACGADEPRVKELAEKWHCSDDDGLVYAERVGAIVQKDGTAWCATRRDFENLQESPAGFGDTVLEALGKLAKELKAFGKGKIGWGKSFADHLAIEGAKAAS